MSSKRVIILSHVLRFPNGLGAAARVANYAVGLSRLGIPTTIMCLKPYEPFEGPILNPSTGFLEGTEFVYTCGTSILAPKKWRRWMQNLEGLFGAVKYLLPLVQQKKVRAILYYGAGYSTFYTFFGWVLSRWAKVSFTGEITEEPFVYSRESVLTKIRRKFFWYITSKLFDGVIVISRYLQAKFKRFVRHQVPVEVIPVMVDISRFNGGDGSPGRHVTFCGSLMHIGELELLLEVWARVSKDFPEYQLRLVGDASSDRMQSLREKVESLDISNSVVFSGLVEREAIPSVLNEAAVLVLPRPAGLFSTAGLPNKLGEYLASGKPVLCTSVGEIPFYLRNGEDAFLVEPSRADLFAERLRWILANPSQASSVGRRGRCIAENAFGLEANCSKLLSILEQLEKERNPCVL